MEKLKKFLKPKIIGVAVMIVLVLVLGVKFGAKIFKPEPKQIYEVAVFAHSQNNSDPEEDKKTSMKKGDVLVTMKDGHNWSRTEMVSYLILRMELTEEQAQKLTQSDEREIPYKELSDEEKQRIDEEKERAKEEDRDYTEEPRRETLRPRLYRIKLEDEKFEGFNRVQLINGQPYYDEVFGWGIVEKKD